jgi:hypothetical protein
MYDRGYERALIEQLLRLIDWMIRLPAALEAEFRQELYAYEEQRQMPYVTTFEQAGIDNLRFAHISASIWNCCCTFVNTSRKTH